MAKYFNGIELYISFDITISTMENLKSNKQKTMRIALDQNHILKIHWNRLEKYCIKSSSVEFIT